MNIKFAKMHGSGNDFMLINGTEHSLPELDKELIRRWSDKRTGIGFDQLLVLNNPAQSDIDFDYQIFNADGNEVAQCGNGARCIARFVTAKGLTDKKTIRVRTTARTMEIVVQDDGNIAVDMGIAEFEPRHIPFNPTDLPVCGEQIEKRLYTLELVGTKVDFSALSFGNPHAVIKVNDIEAALVAEVGSALQAHRCFPESVNVSFVEVRDSVLHTRVYERGVGETQACGSGACAVAVVARLQNWIPQASHSVSVQLSGGEVSILFEGGRSKLVGPAEFVYEDQIKV